MDTVLLLEPKPALSRPLQGRTALVTGASRGIGRAIAKELAERGATVIINFFNRIDRAQELRDEIESSGGETCLMQGDVSDRQEARRVIHKLLDVYGRLDILVNNAGITRDRSIRKMTDSDWLEVMETNLNSIFYCTSAAVAAMVQHKYGRIVNIASFSGQAGNFGQANYAASKGGIIAFTKVLALELAKYNITANVVAPGFTNTDMLAAVPGDIQDQIRARIPLGRFAQPLEVAKAVAFLICDGDYVTGQQININGGIYM
ncbi:MAG TPA: 3-oxoacyl-ACP reductase family protein [Acidobacteriaceae bacterium]|jgi:acetoacetyl-CoA reductase/3-oxoacyl-[acyl-carrier protein] reductase|nr:3-oxoacyl-ACP reductase family protein [Acidobacteriaceae bacterium]